MVTLLQEVFLWEARWGGYKQWKRLGALACNGEGTITVEQIRHHIGVGRDLIDGLDNVFEATVPSTDTAHEWRYATDIIERIIDNIGYFQHPYLE